MPPTEKDVQSWNRIALISIPNAHKDFGRLVLIVQLDRHDLSSEEYWGNADNVQVWTEHSMDRLEPIWCLYKSSLYEPMIWTHACDDLLKSLKSAPWEIINLLSDKKKREFVARFLEYLKPHKAITPKQQYSSFSDERKKEWTLKAWVEKCHKKKSEEVEWALNKLTKASE